MTRHRKNKRTGTVLICVMTCLLVSTSIAASALSAAVRKRRSMAFELQLRQTELLLEAGIRRAAIRLAGPEPYVGESWQPDMSRPQLEQAQIQIVVAPKESGNAIDVSVLAAIGSAQSNTRTQRSHRFQTTRLQSSSLEKK